MIISPFTPLFFDRHESDGIESRYVQTFANTDRILIESFSATPGGEYAVQIYNPDGFVGSVPMGCTQIGETYLYFCTLSGLTDGIYTVIIPGWPESVQSSPFRVTSDPQELALTTLIQYSMKDNRQRTDAVFIIDGMRHFFDFRVPGGFKDSGWTFAVDNEQFSTPDADIVELYAIESTQKRFTLGGQIGVPVQFAELLNRLLTCTYVYFDGVRYARKDSSAPEMTVQMEGLDSFVFTQNLQKVCNLSPILEESNHIVMRRTGNDSYRATEISDQSVTNRITH